MMRKRSRIGLMAMALLLAGSPVLAADDVGSFYKGKTIRVVVGFAPSGGYDLYARLFAKYMGKHIPGNPGFIVQNMTGAGSRVAANWIYNVAPKDGTAFGVVGQGTPSDEALNEDGVQFKSAQFNWIGNPIVDNNVTFLWAASGLKTMEDVIAKGGVICGGSGATSPSVTYPLTIKRLTGADIKVINGYQGGADMNLAIERGELNCRGGNSWTGNLATLPDWFKDKKVEVIVQWGPRKDPAISAFVGRDVPLIDEYAKTDDDRQGLKLITSGVGMGRPFVAPPDVPKERIEALRSAFARALNDPELVAEAAKAKLDLNPMLGEELQKYAAEVASAPPSAIRRAKELIDPKDVEDKK
jgi:tripartite-type tricarboxylate transporter receptor subunit TctC